MTYHVKTLKRTEPSDRWSRQMVLQRSQLLAAHEFHRHAAGQSRAASHSH